MKKGLTGRTPKQRSSYSRWCSPSCPLCQDPLICPGPGVGSFISLSDDSADALSWGDFTKMNVAEGDMGGELDPHGATGNGNPVGGNVTSNISGEDVHYEEWMK